MLFRSESSTLPAVEFLMRPLSMTPSKKVALQVQDLMSLPQNLAQIHLFSRSTKLLLHPILELPPMKPRNVLVSRSQSRFEKHSLENSFQMR